MGQGEGVANQVGGARRIGAVAGPKVRMRPMDLNYAGQQGIEKINYESFSCALT